MADFDPEAYLQSKAPLTNRKPTAAPGDVPVSPIDLQQFDPDAYLRDKQTAHAVDQQAQFGGLGQQALGGVEALARGATLGLSDQAEAKLAQSGLLPESLSSEMTPQKMTGRSESNPVTSFAGNILGSIPAAMGLGEVAGAAKLGALGTEAAIGGALGGGNYVSEAALGDEKLNAEKLLAHVGMGAAIGTGFGALGKAVKAAPAFFRGIGEKANPETIGVPGNLAAGTSQEPIVNVPLGQKASSYEELKSQIAQAKKNAGDDSFAFLPVKDQAQQAAERIAPEMQIPITDMQLNSLNSEDAKLAFKTMAEVPGKEGQILRDAHVGQKKELNSILDQTINEISPGYAPTTDAAEGGERASQALTDQIEGVQNEIGPAIKEIKNTPLADMDHMPGVIDYLTDKSASNYANPKIANMFDTTGEGINIKPYTTSMGIDKSTYRALKDAITSLEENPQDFEKLFDIRKGLSQNVDVTKLGDAAKEIGQAKAALMDYIQEAVQSVRPNVAVRDTFAKYAKNEENRQLIEKEFGAEIGSGNFRSQARGKPEEAILKKIFSNSATTQAVKDILPSEQFQKLLADHLAIVKNEVTDQGTFSANKFMSKIGKGLSKYAMDNAFTEQPGVYQKLKDIITTMRAFTDDMPINPSGTAKTLLQAIKSTIEHPSSVFGQFGELGKQFLKDHELRSQINEQLAGQQAQNVQLKSVQGILKKVSNEIASNAKDIFKSDALKKAGLSAAVQMTDSEFHKISKSLGDISVNPTGVLEHMAHNTDDLHQVIPNTTENIQSSVVNGYNFLKSKMPNPPSEYLLSKKWEPTKDQLSTFSKYYNALNNPLGVLKQVNHGTLTNEAMEAMQSVHPQLLQEMRQQVIQNLKPEQAKQLNYGKKLSLSKFLGQPLDSSMTPGVILASQAVYNPPSQASQPQKKKKPSQSGLNKLNLAKRTSTSKDLEDE